MAYLSISLQRLSRESETWFVSSFEDDELRFEKDIAENEELRVGRGLNAAQAS